MHELYLIEGTSNINKAQLNGPEYNDPNLDNYQKQFYIKNAFSKADRLAYADLIQNTDLHYQAISLLNF